MASLLFLLVLSIIVFILRRHHLKGATQSFDVIGKCGTVHTSLAPQGSILIDGELWLARTANDAYLPVGQSVRAVRTAGHVLIVEAFV